MKKTLAILALTSLLTTNVLAETKEPVPILAKTFKIDVDEILRFQGYTHYPAATTDFCKYAGKSNKTQLINKDRFGSKCPKTLIGVEKMPDKNKAANEDNSEDKS